MADNDQFLVEMGRRILHQRKQMHLSQEKLAELAGVSIKTVSSAENGQKALRPENIVRFARALEVNASYLLTGEISVTTNFSNLSHKEYVALQQILGAFFSICEGEMPYNGITTTIVD